VDNVLGLARTGLIFTGLQEGAQPGGGGDPTWPNRARYSILCDVMLGFGEGGGVAGTRGCSGACSTSPVRESRSVVRVCVVFSSLFVLLLLLFPLFAVLLNCPYPDPLVFCLFLSILLRTAAGGGAAAWCF